MNINPFKRIADLEAKLEAMEADHTKRFIELTDHWNRMAKVESKAAAAMSTASTSMDVMTKLPSIAVVEEAVALAKKFDERLDRVRDRIDKDMLNLVTRVRDLGDRVKYLEGEMDARKESANYLHDYVKALDKDVALLKALRNVVTPEEVSRKAISAQSAHEQAQIERNRAKQREYNAAYRARQKAKRAEEAKRIKQREYKRAWMARKKAEKAAAQEAAQ
jgi:hypothetical protein